MHTRTHAPARARRRARALAALLFLAAWPGCARFGCGAGASASHAIAAPPATATELAAAGAQPGAAPPEASGPWEWDSRGIGGGGTFLAAAISPHDPRVMAISTDMGMAFQTWDRGPQWAAVHFEELRGTDRATPRWTADPSVLYAIDWRGYEGAFPVRSTNGGAGWERLPSDPSHGEAWGVEVDPSRTDRILLVGWAAIWLSNDRGGTWTQIAEAASREAGITVAGVVWAGPNVLIGTSDAMLVSADGGATFAVHPYVGLPAGQVVGSFTGAFDGTTLRIWVVSREAGTVWPGIRQDQWAGYRGVWTADVNADATLRPLAGALPRSFFAVTVASTRQNLDIVYLSGADTEASMPAVYRSTDGGSSWVSTFQTADNRNIATGWCGARGDLDFWWSAAPTTFAVSPSDPSALIMGDYGFVHVSSDGGATWQQAYTAVEDQNPPATPTPKGRAYRGVGLEDTSAWWLQWVDARTLFAGFSDIRGILSADGGLRWRAGVSLGLPHNSTYHVVAHPQTGALYAATASIHDLYQSTYLTDDLIRPGEGQVITSTDGGATWTTVHDMGKSVVWLALDPRDANTLYASVVDRLSGGVYVTRNLDAGAEATWRRLAAPVRTEGHAYNVHVLADGTLVTTWSGRRESDAFTRSSGVFVSTDGGDSWTDRSHSDMRLWTRDLVIDPHDPTQSTWYVGVFSHWGAAPNEVGGLFRTRDRGLTWQRLSSLYRVESVAVDPANPDLMFVATETQGLWATESATSDAPEFRQVITYPFEHPTRVFFSPHDPAEVWVTSFGGGLRVWNRDDGRGGLRRPSLAAARAGEGPVVAGATEPVDAGSGSEAGAGAVGTEGGGAGGTGP